MGLEAFFVDVMLVESVNAIRVLSLIQVRYVRVVQMLM